MRFLVVSKPKHMVPPDVMVGLLDAMGTWQSKHAGKLEQVWGFAGTHGGGGICKVDSLEELDTLMSDFPFLAMSDVKIYPLVDMAGALQRAKQSLQAMLNISK